MARKTRKKTTEVTQDVYIPETKDSSKSKVAEASGDVVTVALCHPHGIQFALDGGKRRVLIQGNAVNLRGQPKGTLPEGGFGLTTIARADWEQIKTLYSDMDIFKRGLIFANAKRSEIEAEADDKAELRHGREPVSTDNAATEPMTGGM